MTPTARLFRRTAWSRLARRTGRTGRTLLVSVLVPALSLDAQGTVRVDTEQARLALAYVRAADAATRDSLWRLHASTRGYLRLKERESSMQRAFTDSTFRAFLDSDAVRAREPHLTATYSAWQQTDFTTAESRARRYLPAGTAMRATVYVTVKPRTNSFVFDTDRDPAIFLYLDPAVGAAEFLNTAAHELHHIGFSAACRDTPVATGAAAARARWLSAFGEGWAMLAASDSAAAHPHASTTPVRRAEWDAALAHASDDMRRLEAFFDGIGSGAIPADSVDGRGFAFFAERPQGPWYTVGWLMTSTIERADGRERLLTHLCSPVRVIERYQQLTAGTTLPRFSDGFVERLRR